MLSSGWFLGMLSSWVVLVLVVIVLIFFIVCIMCILNWVLNRVYIGFLLLDRVFIVRFLNGMLGSYRFFRMVGLFVKVSMCLI